MLKLHTKDYYFFFFFHPVKTSMIDFLHIFLTNKKKTSHTLLKNNSHNWLQQHKWNWIQKKRYLDIWPLLFGWLLLLWIYFDCKKKRMFTTIFLSLYLWCKRRFLLWLGLFWTLLIIFIVSYAGVQIKTLKGWLLVWFTATA